MFSYVFLWIYSAFWSLNPTLAVSTSPPPCLSGIINHYTPVLGFGCDSSTLQVGALTGFAVGDKVLLLQMQVPQVDLSNTPNFGTVLNTVCIGNYEFNRIQSIGGNTIQLQFALTRSYDLSGKVQLVRVPEYDSATVCNITCLPWNGSIGGVLALDVKTQLTLTGHIDVSGRGFRGGIVESNDIPWVFGEQQYFYSQQSTLAAEKGEGIVSIPADFSFGRGRAGNGGGGGNAHNGGGGGGTNAGSGGNGGLEITNIPAPPTPNTDGLGGQKYFDNQTNKIEGTTNNTKFVHRKNLNNCFQEIWVTQDTIWRHIFPHQRLSEACPIQRNCIKENTQCGYPEMEIRKLLTEQWLVVQ